MPEMKIKVAVIGSGLAGLTAAYLLARDAEKRYSVEIFEMVSDRAHPSLLYPIYVIAVLIDLRSSDSD